MAKNFDDFPGMSEEDTQKLVTILKEKGLASTTDDGNLIVDAAFLANFFPAYINGVLRRYHEWVSSDND